MRDRVRRNPRICDPASLEYAEAGWKARTNTWGCSLAPMLWIYASTVTHMNAHIYTIFNLMFFLKNPQCLQNFPLWHSVFPANWSHLCCDVHPRFKCVSYGILRVYPKYSLIHDSRCALTMQPQKLRVTFPPSRKQNCQCYLLLSTLCALYWHYQYTHFIDGRAEALVTYPRSPNSYITQPELEP